MKKYLLVLVILLWPMLLVAQDGQESNDGSQPANATANGANDGSPDANDTDDSGDNDNSADGGTDNSDSSSNSTDAGDQSDDNSTDDSEPSDDADDGSADGDDSADDVDTGRSMLADASQASAYMTEMVALYAPRTIGALIVLIIFWILSGVVAGLVAKAFQRTDFDETLERFFAKMSRWLVLILGVLACMSVFGIETTSFAAILGAAGFAVGLSLQGTLANFASGVMLLVFRPFKVDDVVNTAGHTGKIDSIAMFTTTMDTFDNRRIIIPNGSVFGSTIENITYHPQRRADVNVGCDYSADIDKTRGVLEKAAASVEGGLEDPAPAVVLLELGGSSVDWSVRVWAKRDDFGSVKQGAIRAVKNALDEAGIGIPYPTMDVNVNQSS